MLIQKDEFDIVIIGAGPGGYHSALRAAQAGARVAIIEKDKIGGLYTSIGCIPIQCFDASVKIYDDIKRKSFFFGASISGKVQLDFPSVVERKNKIVHDLVARIEALLNLAKVKIFKGTGRVVSGNAKDGFCVRCIDQDGISKELVGKRVIIATGSVPSTIPVFNIDHERILTSDDILKAGFNDLPKSMIIIGGGVIGCECAEIFSRFGVDITIIEFLDSIMPENVELNTLLKSDWGKKVLQSLFQDDVDTLLDAHVPTRTKASQREQLRAALEKFKASCNDVEQELFETEMEQLIMFENHARRYENACWIVVKRNEHVARAFRTLLGIPNVGPATSIGTVAEMVSVSHFKEPDQLVKWAGLAPKVKQSGHKKHVTGKLHKGGNKYLRRHLTLACTNMYSQGAADHPIATYILEKYASTGKYWEAICAGARKLSRVMWYLLKNDTSWSPPGIETGLLADIEKLVGQKIRRHQNAIKRCEALKAELKRESSEILNRVRAHSTTHRNKILQALMKST
ncbi:MAG: FAD-dependent oxidoreductase [Candidatus Sigynarchaeota archaeon]